MLIDFQNSFTSRRSGKFATNSHSNVPPYLSYVATLRHYLVKYLCSKYRHAQQVGLIEENCHVRLSHSKNSSDIFVW